MDSTIKGLTLLPYQKKKIKIIIDHLKKKKNLHIYGTEGTGKSVLLDWIYDNFQEIDNSLIPIYCRSSRMLRHMLLYISGFLLNHFKQLESIDKFKRIKKITNSSDIKKLNIRTLKNLIFSYIPQDNFCIILDHLEYITPKIISFLSPLYEKASVVSASRQSWEITDYAFKGRLDYCLYLIPKVKIENLKKKEAVIFMKHLYEDFNLNVQEKLRIFEDVFRASKGNPRIIKKIFEKAQERKYFKGDRLNLNLILIDCRMNTINV